jgi:hypothetical protein
MDAEKKITAGDEYWSGSILNNAEEELKLAKEKHPSADLRNIDHYLAFLDATLESLRGNNQKGYDLLIALLEKQSTTDAPEPADTKIRAGAQQFALGWNCERLKRPVEAAAWYFRSAKADHPYAYQMIYLLWNDNPEIAVVLTQSMQQTLQRAKKDGSEQKPAPIVFEELMKKATVTPAKPPQ